MRGITQSLFLFSTTKIEHYLHWTKKLEVLKVSLHILHQKDNATGTQGWQLVTFLGMWGQSLTCHRCRRCGNQNVAQRGTLTAASASCLVDRHSGWLAGRWHTCPAHGEPVLQTLCCLRLYTRHVNSFWFCTGLNTANSDQSGNIFVSVQVHAKLLTAKQATTHSRQCRCQVSLVRRPSTEKRTTQKQHGFNFHIQRRRCSISMLSVGM